AGRDRPWGKAQVRWFRSVVKNPVKSSPMNCPKCRYPIPPEDLRSRLPMECARCGTRFRIEQSGLLTERTAPDVARTEPIDPPRRRLAPGTKIGLVVCLVPLTILLLGVLWFVVWGGRQRRISSEAARQFLEDLLVVERVPLAYQRCTTAFRKKFPEQTLLKYA